MIESKILRNNKDSFRLLSYSVCITILIIVTFSSVSCKKLIDVKAPVTSTNAANVYTNDATATAVLTGIYAKMSSAVFANGGIASISLFAGLSADELTLYNGVTNVSYIGYYKNALTSTNTQFSDFWNNLYPLIYYANTAIEGINQSESLTPAVKQQLTGEAKFIRAFCYFYLVNLYGEVPLALTTDYTINASLTRSSKANVYEQIINDLKDAQASLSNKYLKSDAITAYATGAEERVRPTKWAATALLARTYLYIQNWPQAEAQASSIINNNAQFDTVSLNKVFLKNSKEAIWQLQPVNTGQNTQDARLFIIPSTGPTASTVNPVYLSTYLRNSFESNDQRNNNWINSIVVGGTTYYYPNKYKVNTLNAPVTEYLMVLRLAEQYLIRAESRAQQDKLSESKADLNVIRARAGLPNTTANDKPSLLGAIIHERQVELFTEWGNRWLDMKRLNQVDQVMSIITPTKGGTWQITDQLYPIPLTEIQRNPNLVQNPGY